MLMPSDIRDQIRLIEQNLSKKGGIAEKLRARAITQLYMEVLEEIARGSPDPKTLAITVLEIKPDWFLS